MRKNLMERMTQTLFGGEIRRQVRAALAAAETEASFLVGARSFNQSDRDRFTYDREKMLELSLEAWRVNPLARRIVELTSQYVVGGGINAESKNDKLSKFISDFWNHRLNRMDVRAFEWCDELTRTGNLFILLSTDQAGMTYVRPKGAFYLFPQTPIDDVEFCRLLAEQKILAVPGRGFGMPGYIRLAFCVDEKVIAGSVEGFKKAMALAKK